MPNWVDLRALLIVTWRQGFKRSTRAGSLAPPFSILKRNPAVWEHYITVCAHNEHFEYRHIVRDQISGQLSLTPEKIL